MKIQSAKAGIGTGRAGLQAASGLFSSAGLFQKGVKSFHPNDLDPYLLFDARTSMIGTLENPTLDLDPATPSTLDVITATRASVATRTLPDGTIATAQPNSVRVDYTQGAELTPTVFQHIGHTDFSTDWTKANVAVSTSEFNAPDGTSTAYKITNSSSSGNHFIRDSITAGANPSTVVSGRSYTLSVFLRKGTKDVVSIGDGFNVNVLARFNLTSGTVTNFSASNSSIEQVGDWFRCSATITTTGTTLGLMLFTGNNYAGHDTSGDFHAFGPQLEEGTTASDFVANTTGSPKFITGATFGPRVPMILVEPSSENLVDYSEDFSQSVWNTGSASVTTDYGYLSPSGDLTATKVTKQNTSGHLYTSENAGAKSIFIKGTAGETVATLDRHTDPNTLITLTGEWQRVELNGINNLFYAVDFRAGTATEVYIWGAQVEAGSVSTSYIPTSGGDAAARTRAADDLSIDPDSTNHITNTDFSTWGTQNITVSSGGGFSGYPSSIITATGTGNKFFTATLSGVTAGQTHTGSIYIRRTNGSGRVDFVHPNSTSGSDSSNRTITTDWIRVTCQFNGSTSSGVVTQFQIRMFTAGDSIEIAMPQVELGSSPTGFIPTSGSPASRTTFSDFYNQSEGTFYAEFEPRELSTSITNTAFELSNGTGAERILSHVDSQIHAYFVDGGNVQANLDGGTNTVGVLNRLALSYKANNIQVSVSGGAVVSDTSASIPTVDRLIIGNQVDDTTRLLNGHVKRFIYWPTHSSRL